tara:strand:+ start:100491 stop:100979 length:489 start_codon:yes stop_codon:yes gene_type:complete
MNNPSETAKNAKYAIMDGLRPYEGRVINTGSITEKQMSEVIENIVGPLSLDDYLYLYNEEIFKHGPMREMLDQARKATMHMRSVKPVESIKIEIKDDNPETDEEREERLRKQEADFFFKKDKDHLECNCGAAYTDFPHRHAEYCRAFGKADKKKEHFNNFWD